MKKRPAFRAEAEEEAERKSVSPRRADEGG